MAVQPLVVGSRESELAQCQARLLMSAWQAAFPDQPTVLKTFKTTGDRQLTEKLSAVGDKGLFVKELEVALLADDIDVAIHSLKDMPGELPEGLSLRSFGKRADPRDVLLSVRYADFNALPPQAVVGTASTRRLAMLQRLRPDLVYKTIRGNLQTRYQKLADGDYDAIVLAAAGVHRLGWADRIRYVFDPETELVPAPGQGTLAVEYRTKDDALATRLAQLSDGHTQTMMLAERQVLQTLEGGCHTPVGAYAFLNDNASQYSLVVQLLSPDGHWAETRQAEFTPQIAVKTAQALAASLKPSILPGTK